MYERDVSAELGAYVKECAERLQRSDFDVLAKIAEKIVETKKTGASIFTAGNGGSASTASHICNDLTKGCRVDDRTGFKAFCLADSSALVTCLANDFCYEDIYSILLETQASPGDLFIVFSGSGNSANIVNGLKKAKEMGMFTIGFGGRDGGKMKALCDLIILAPTDSMEMLEDMHLVYEHALVCSIREMLRDVWDTETVEYPKGGFPFEYALFDFDGTVSLIREGWREVMVPYFAEVLCEYSGSYEENYAFCGEFVDFLTGKQTIFQCIRMNEEVVKRGGPERDPLEYKREYLRRLEEVIADRKAELESDPSKREKYMVPGTVEFLTKLKATGINMILASGTDESDVFYEAELLGLREFFGDNIFGARDEMKQCSKEMVIRDLINTTGITGDKLLSFGDGYVEIELVRDIGGYSVGVATDEVRKKGVNPVKRQKLLHGGACVIVPDFSEPELLMKYLKR